MACEFFKVSLYFFIYDRWPVSEREKAPYCEYNTSVITSKTVLHGTANLRNLTCITNRVYFRIVIKKADVESLRESFRARVETLSP